MLIRTQADGIRVALNHRFSWSDASPQLLGEARHYKIIVPRGTAVRTVFFQCKPHAEAPPDRGGEKLILIPD